MRWQEVCEHPDLKNLPFKIELDEYGRIVMSPAKVIHSILQGRIEALLRERLAEGAVFPECAIATSKGTKVADVVWASAGRLAVIRDEVEASVAPELCVEIVSASNTAAGIREKVHLYLEAGAREVWLCGEDGRLSFHSPAGELERSEVVSGFPDRVEV